MMLKQLVLNVRLPLSPGRKKIILMETEHAKITLQNVESIVSNYVIFSIKFEAEKITKLCNAAYTDENLFWRLLKERRSNSQMTAFLVDGKIITKKKQILDMWADHFKALGTPSVSARYDNDFCTRIATSVKDILTSCIEDPSGVLNEPLQYDEFECVCSQLKPGVSTDYEHIRFAGSNLWVLLHQLFQNFFEKFSVCLRITSAHFPQIFTTISIRPGKKLV